MAGVGFDPDRDIPSLKDKVIFITGGTAGLGRTSIEALAKHDPSHIYFTGRNEDAATSLVETINRDHPLVGLTFLPLDLSSLASISIALKTLLASGTLNRLDILICCAGIMATPPSLSADGYEIQFATNHLGHAALIRHLLPILLNTTKLPGSDVRIVLVSSIAWSGHPRPAGINFSTLSTPQASLFGHWVRYSQSKLANIVYARELARRLPEIVTVAVHPGTVNTELVRRLRFWDGVLVKIGNLRVLGSDGMLSVGEGVKNQLFLAVGMPRGEVVNGAIYYPVGKLFEGLSAIGKSRELGEELWEWTEKALKSHEKQEGEPSRGLNAAE